MFSRDDHREALLKCFPAIQLNESVVAPRRRQDFDGMVQDGQTWLDLNERIQLDEDVMWDLTPVGLTQLLPAYLCILADPVKADVLVDHVTSGLLHIFDQMGNEIKTVFTPMQVQCLDHCLNSLLDQYQSLEQKDYGDVVKKLKQIITNVSALHIN